MPLLFEPEASTITPSSLCESRYSKRFPSNIIYGAFCILNLRHSKKGHTDFHVLNEISNSRAYVWHTSSSFCRYFTDEHSNIRSLAYILSDIYIHPSPIYITPKPTLKHSVTETIYVYIK